MNDNQNEKLTRLAQASTLLAAIGEEKSFTKAAEKLNVHQSAVSHRTKALEEAIGFTLFERTTRHLKFTEAGKILCEAANNALTTWETALEKLNQSRSSNQILLSLPSSLAMKWLIPILPRAQATGLEISIEVDEKNIDFHENKADAAIRFGHGPYPGLHSTHLAHSWLQPVASPAYLKNNSNHRSPLDNPNAVFLSDRRGESDNTDFNWAHYFSALDQPRDNFEANYPFDRADLMLQGVIGGIGIGLGRTLLMESDIHDGFLVPIGPSVRMRPAYWLICSATFAQTKNFGRLQNWLKSEVQRTTQQSTPH